MRARRACPAVNVPSAVCLDLQSREHVRGTRRLGRDTCPRTSGRTRERREDPRSPALPGRKLSASSPSWLGDAKFSWPEDFMAELVVAKMNEPQQRVLALGCGSECLLFRTLRASAEDAPTNVKLESSLPAPWACRLAEGEGQSQPLRRQEGQGVELLIRLEGRRGGERGERKERRARRMQPNISGSIRSVTSSEREFSKGGAKFQDCATHGRWERRRGPRDPAKMPGVHAVSSMRLAVSPPSASIAHMSWNVCGPWRGWHLRQRGHLVEGQPSFEWLMQVKKLCQSTSPLPALLLILSHFWFFILLPFSFLLPHFFGSKTSALSPVLTSSLLERHTHLCPELHPDP